MSILILKSVKSTARHDDVCMEWNVSILILKSVECTARHVDVCMEWNVSILILKSVECKQGMLTCAWSGM